MENHLNYICHPGRSLTHDEALGIAAVLNSRLLDVYFRTISGNTQVNAAEVRAMPFPNLLMLAKLGEAVSASDLDDRQAIEATVLHLLGINGRILEYLLT